MDLNINTWNITFTQNNIDNYDIHSLLHYYFMTRNDSMSYLLNPNLEKYNIIEKIVYDIAMFHFRRLGIEYNKDEYYIEFWFKGTFKSTCHIDTDEYEREFNCDFKYENGPILSCVTYFSESNIPTIITDITSDDYKNDNYSEKNKIFLSFPKYLKQITFNGGKYYHGTCKIFENDISINRYVLVINLWNGKQNKIPYFDNHIFQYTNYKKEMINVTIDNDSDLLKITKMEKIGRFIIDNGNNENNKSLIHKSLFKEFINQSKGKYYHFFYHFSNILNENNFENYDLIELSNKIPLSDGTEIFEKNMEKEVNNVVERTEKKMEEKNTEQNIIKKDIFTKQRIIEKSFFDHVTCDWIINSVEKYIMKKNKGKSFSKINIDFLKNIQSFIGFSLENLFKTKIVKFYNLNDEKQKFMIKNIHVLKLDNTNTKIHEELADLTIKIVLNNGLTINFKDGTKIILNKGDFITHNSFSIETLSFNSIPCYMLIADIVS
jgi:hypothetical protein